MKYPQLQKCIEILCHCNNISHRTGIEVEILEIMENRHASENLSDYELQLSRYSAAELQELCDGEFEESEMHIIISELFELLT